MQRSGEILKPRDSGSELTDRSETWQAKSRGVNISFFVQLPMQWITKSTINKQEWFWSYFYSIKFVSAYNISVTAAKLHYDSIIHDECMMLLKWTCAYQLSAHSYDHTVNWTTLEEHKKNILYLFLILKTIANKPDVANCLHANTAAQNFDPTFFLLHLFAWIPIFELHCQ